MFGMRWRLGVATLALVGGLHMGCGGASSSAPTTPQPAPGSAAQRAGQAQMPPPQGNPDQLYDQAYQAWQAGQFPEAQRLFGVLYIAAPGYRGDIAAQALGDTCTRLRQDCRVVLARLDLMREAFHGRAGGPIQQWVPDQRAAFDDIIACYDHLLLGEPNDAVQRAARWATAPVPSFAASARFCMQGAEAFVRQREREALAAQALDAWRANYDCMVEYRRQLLETASQGLWEVFAEIYPNYLACANVIQSIVDAGVLEGDSRVGMQHEVAWSQLSDVAAIVEDNQAAIDAAVHGVQRLSGDAEHNYLNQELQRLQNEQRGLESQIQALQTARASLTGPERDQIDGTLRALQSSHANLRRRIFEVQSRIDEIRQAAGLAPRFTPR